ncbi:MAG: papain-like cysteine protease family protein [Candidatus Sericytochromatia bacterium]
MRLGDYPITPATPPATTPGPKATPTQPATPAQAATPAPATAPAPSSVQVGSYAGAPASADPSNSPRFRQPVGGASRSTPTLTEAQIRTKLAERLGAAWTSLPPEQQTRLAQSLQRLGVTEADMSTPQTQGFKRVNTMLDSLSALASTGRLSGEVVAAIDNLSSAELHPDLTSQRLDLVRSALQDIAVPSLIAQHNRGTCAATVPQMQLAISNPARYLQIVQALASPSGQVGADIVAPVQPPNPQETYENMRRLASGLGLPEPVAPDPNAPVPPPQPLARDEGTLADDGSGRSITSRLMQPALMEYANGEAQTYDNATDLHSSGRSGLYQHQATTLLNALGIPGNYSDRVMDATLVSDIESAVQHGRPVPVSISWQNLGSANHELLVTQIDRSNNTVYFMNPWGQLNTMSLTEFEARLDSASMPRDFPPDKRDAYASLPPPANDLSAYHQLPWTDFRSVEQQLRYEPRLTQHLDAQQSADLGKTFARLNLPPFLLEQLTPVIEAGHADAAFFTRLANLPADPDAARSQAQNLILLYHALESHPVPGKTPSEAVAQLESTGLNLSQPTIIMDLERLISSGELTPAFIQALADADDPEELLTDKALEVNGRREADKRNDMEDLLQDLDHATPAESRP